MLTLKPTLWRTCRVLANRVRLKLLQELVRKPGQCVTGLSVALGLPLALTSKYLRELNARGLLEARRSGREVGYVPIPDRSVPQANVLLAAVKRTFFSRLDGIEFIFRLATALTHPRRVAIVKRLARGHSRFLNLCADTGISQPAMARHLAKLKARHIVRYTKQGYALMPPSSVLARVLIDLAADS